MIQPPFDPPDGERGQHHRAKGDDADNPQQPRGRIGVEEMADRARGDGNAEDHQKPGDRGGGGAAARFGRRGEQRQKRRARSADTKADQHIGEDRQEQRLPPDKREKHDGQRGQKGAKRQNRHAEDDKEGAVALGIGAQPPGGTGDLQPVMQRHQRARQHRGQRQFHHHQPVQRRGGQHHHRADAQLHQPQPENLEPAQRHTVKPRIAKAVIIMPETYITTPVPLYQGALPSGSRIQTDIAQNCPNSRTRTAVAWKGFENR